MKALASFRREPGTCEALNQSAVSCERGLTRDVRARVIAFLCRFSLFCCSWGVISRSDTTVCHHRPISFGNERGGDG